MRGKGYTHKIFAQSHLPRTGQLLGGIGLMSASLPQGLFSGLKFLPEASHTQHFETRTSAGRVVERRVASSAVRLMS